MRGMCNLQNAQWQGAYDGVSMDFMAAAADDRCPALMPPNLCHVTAVLDVQTSSHLLRHPLFRTQSPRQACSRACVACVFCMQHLGMFNRTALIRRCINTFPD